MAESRKGRKLTMEAQQHVAASNAIRNKTPEMRALSSERAKARNRTPEMRQRMRIIAKARNFTSETRRRLSESHKGDHWSQERRRHASELTKTRNWTPQMRKNLSESLKGRLVSQATRRKLSIANEGHKHTTETRSRMSKRLKACWADPAFVQKMLRAFAVRPTRPEAMVAETLTRLGQPFRLNAVDAMMLVGRRIPDFTATDGSRRIIEVFGEVFHDRSVGGPRVKPRQTLSATLADYKALQYECLVLWSKPITENWKHGTIDVWLMEQINMGFTGLPLI